MPVVETAVPREGMLATVRNRRGLVTSVTPYGGGPEGQVHLVTVEYIAGAGAAEARLSWERAVGAEALNTTGGPRGDRGTTCTGPGAQRGLGGIGPAGAGAQGAEGPGVTGPGVPGPPPVVGPPPALGGTTSPGPRYWPPWASRASGRSMAAHAKLDRTSLFIWLSEGVSFVDDD